MGSQNTQYVEAHTDVQKNLIRAKDKCRRRKSKTNTRREMGKLPLIPRRGVRRY